MYKRIEMIIHEIENIRNGAFSPLSQHPVLRAILIPLGGTGILAFVEFFGLFSG